jgi:hypothetical protein
LARTEHPTRKSQIEQAIVEIDKRLASVTAAKPADKKAKK